MVVRLKDGTERQIPHGSTAADLAATISARLAREAVLAKVNGVIQDLDAPLPDGADVEILTFESDEALEAMRHTAAHVMAQAVCRLFPGTKLAIGPAIKDGFYYDFAMDHSLSPEDLPRIEAEMRKIIAEKLPLQRAVMDRQEALQFLAEQGEDFKVELIEDLPEDAEISFYRQGEFIDLCAGPHVPHTGFVKAVRLLSLAGAYWRGDERRPMLQRIYGTAFAKASELEAHLQRIEEAKKRDHRKLGRELELFTIEDEGPGFPFFLPKGMVVRNELEQLWREEHRRAGYLEIRTPIILNRQLWERSGHWDHYRENMYFTQIDDNDYAIKPMNCPGAMLAYRNKLHSYKDLPLRLAEIGLVHRHEKSGVLHGMMRVRAFNQDDSHVFMTPEQIESELSMRIDLVDHFYQVFGFTYHVELSTRPENSMGSDEVWELAEGALQKVLDAKKISYTINEGDGAFYGPKIDFHLTDCLGRSWQCATIQLDFQMPEKFGLYYIGEDGERHTPVVVHSVAFGAIERFLAILIEHFAGAFPLWLAPVQVKVMPITDRVHDYATSVYQTLFDAGLRVELDDRNEKIGFKIREAQLAKIPYMLVVGDREAEAGVVAVRHRERGDLGTMDLHQLIEELQEAIVSKRIS
ncbi:MAG: threonine--tRNA ligase [Firmicutes bacterium]|nr:threonine--tRNA ligase [Bacillota bacterium]